MAEIKIQEKRKSNWLPLVLGAVLLLALLGWCFTRDRAPEGVVPADTTVTAPTTAPGGATTPATPPPPAP